MKRFIRCSKETDMTKEELLSLLKSRGIDTTKQRYELRAEEYQRYEQGEVYTIRFSCPGDYLAYFSMHFHEAPSADKVLEWEYEIENEWISLYDIAKHAASSWWGDGDDYIIYLKNLTTGKVLYARGYAGEGEEIDSDDYDWE